MAAQRHVAKVSQPAGMSLTAVASFERMRALYWQGNELFVSRGYRLLRARIRGERIEWNEIGLYEPAWWRRLSSSSRLASRVVRDGFHALAVSPSGNIVAAVPGAVITLPAGESRFRMSHKVMRGTRPLHIAATPDGRLFWGEYFDNSARDEVHIYASDDGGTTWQVGYSFPKGSIRHVHNIVHDAWENCLWILTGDEGAECRILRASCDLRTLDEVLAGSQQARAVALVPARDGMFFSSDTPYEENHIYFLDRQGTLVQVANLSSSSIYGCGVGDAVFFSTMVEPSKVNMTREVNVFGTMDGKHWQRIISQTKDAWPMSLFQYGNAFLPDGNNTTEFLAVSTIAVTAADLQTSLWRVCRTSMV